MNQGVALTGRPTCQPDNPRHSPPAQREVNACCSQAPSLGCPITDSSVGVTRGKRGGEGEEAVWSPLTEI